MSADKSSATKKINQMSDLQQSRSGLNSLAQSSIGLRTMSFVSNLDNDSASASKLFPSQKLQGDKLIEVLTKLKQDIANQNLSIQEVFRRLDSSSAGLLSFGAFSLNIDKITQLSQSVKEKLFARMDTMGVGLISLEQFREFINLSNVKLRDESLTLPAVIDSFDWEQSIIKQISDWIKDKNYTVSEAFKILDQDFDGQISLQDLRIFLSQVLKVKDSEIISTKLERLFKILDITKSGKIFQSDFESMFA